MGIVIAIFVFGGFVTAFVCVGLVFAMSALAPDGPGASEGKALEEDIE